jgi:hypothetical protein
MRIRSWLLVTAASAVVVLTLVVGVVRAPSAHADVWRVPDSDLDAVSADLIQVGRTITTTRPVTGTHHYRIGMSGLGGCDLFENCVEGEPGTNGTNGGVVQISPCITHPVFVPPGWQWGWRFARTEVTGLYRIHLGTKCLDADNRFGIRRGDKVQLWECIGTGQHNQYWWLVGNPYDRDTIQIVSHANGMCLSIDADRNFARYSPAVMLDCHWLGSGGIKGQRFTPEARTWPGEPEWTTRLIAAA